MKKIIISLILIISIIGLACTLKDIVVIDSTANNNRFIQIAEQGNFIFYYDRETKVQYIVSNSSYNRGNATVLVDQEGKPLLYKEAE